MKHQSAKSRIVELAKSRGVMYQCSEGDELAGVITRLSGDEVNTDEVENLLVALRRSNVISDAEMVELLGQYLDEKRFERDQ